MTDEELITDSGLEWSHPSPARDGTTDGFVWVGNAQATRENKQQWVDFLNQDGGNREIEDVAWDGRSLVGLYAKSWSSNYYSQTDGSAPGGAGSHTYETQMWGGVGCEFKDSKCWHYNTAGALVKEVPANCGEVYRVDMSGGYYDYWAGVEPKSDAEKYLDGGIMTWDEDEEYYVRG
jgi:hypothetical protein